MRATHLESHPEGGRYREVFRSPTRVRAIQGERNAVTHIYFSLAKGEVSRFHCVASDEIWNLYRGSGLRLLLWDDNHATLTETCLRADDEVFCAVVPAGIWQAAEPLGGKVLVGCTVAPGFEFEDFKLIDAESPTMKRIRQHGASLSRFF